MTGCQDSGFLPWKACGKEVVFMCSRCSKPLCQHHSHSYALGTVCTACKSVESDIGGAIDSVFKDLTDG